MHSKNRALRVRSDNPVKGIRPPERGERKAKQYLYPSELMKLVSCETRDAEGRFLVPLRDRVLYAVAVYTFARAGELEALTWDDVDFDHGIIHIVKAVDRRTGKVKGTKTGETRRIPIEPHLLPLLQRLHAERKGPAVVSMPDDEDRAVGLREALLVAGVRRAELFITDAQRKDITFPDLRATGITWMAVRGDNPLTVKGRAGHRSFSTTEIYIREAENLTAGFGEPFPELPSALTGSFGSVLASFGSNQRNHRGASWSKGGSNP